MRFRHQDGSTVHLAYCTNVHAAEQLDGVIRQLTEYAEPVRRRLHRDRLGIGLWLARDAARTLTDDPAAVRALRTALERQPRLWGVFAITILSTAAYMITFNYLAAILSDVSGLSTLWIPAVLALFGIGAFGGVTIGGRISDRRPHLALLAGTTGIAVLSVLLAVFAAHPVVVVPLVFVLGVAAFVLNPAVYGRVFAIAAEAPTLPGATTVSAFQLGISLTPLLAAWALNEEASVTSVAWIGAGLALAAVPFILVDRRRGRG